MLKWLKNMMWEYLTEWERDFVDSMWVDSRLFSFNQSMTLSDLFEKYRRNREWIVSRCACKPCLAEYNDIHDFDR